MCTEAEFLDVIRTKVLRVFLLDIHSTSTKEPQRNCTFMNSASVQKSEHITQ
jgi:hypothetical protein